MRKGDRAVLQADTAERLTEGAPEHEARRAGWITRDLDVAPGHTPREPRAKGLQRCLPRGDPPRQVRAGARLGTAVRQLHRVERAGQEVVAPVDARPDRRDV